MQKIFENPLVAIIIILGLIAGGVFIGRSQWFNNLINPSPINPPPPPPDPNSQLRNMNSNTILNGQQSY